LGEIISDFAGLTAVRALHQPLLDMVRLQEKRRPQQKQAGFTLTEMMVVVAVIAITAGLAAPAMYNSFAERRASSAPIDLVRLVRRGRSEAMAYGRAHLLRFTETSPGSFTLYRGVSSGCSANDWPTIVAAASCGAIGSKCIDQMLMSSDYYSTGSLDVRAAEAGGTDNIDICYEPTGRMLHRAATTGAFSDQNTVNGGFVFNFIRYESGSALGVTRRVALPLGGEARVLR